MKKRVKGVKLSRRVAARTGLVKNLAKALIISEKITTTKPKANFAQKFVEKLVRLAKRNSLTANRKIFALIGSKSATKKLVSEIGPKFAAKKSGFTRIINLGYRLGDNAPLAQLEFAYPAEEKVSKETKETKGTEATEVTKETKATKEIKGTKAIKSKKEVKGGKNAKKESK